MTTPGGAEMAIHAQGDDPWAVLRRATRARVALGRAGDGLPTVRELEFRAAHAAGTVAAVLDRLPGWSVGPLVLAHQARVALGDPVGQALGARIVVVAVGERPGLSSADSLGLYLTHDPRPGRVDAERNCISNVRPPHGLGYAQAADTLVALLQASRELGASGVVLKDDGGALTAGAG
jgi:ethanolamine ammonia-lyase small subunit